MITLGIHDGHTATACIVKDGKILAVLSEERLNRVKEWGGFPHLAVKECLRIAKIKPEEIDGVAIVGLLPPTLPQNYQTPPWFKRLFGVGVKVFPSRLFQSEKWISWAKVVGSRFRGKTKLLQNLNELGINCRVKFYDHHYLHAVTGYYLNPIGKDKILILTCDGSGDGICATCNIGEADTIRRVSEISTYNSISEFYTQITHYLGMKPMSHEYKVMGLAPYAKEERIEKIMKVFRGYFKLDKIKNTFINTSSCWKWQYLGKFQKDLKQMRFDEIAGGTQRIFEEIMKEWIKGWVRRTGIKKVVLSGGSFLNVKANNLILNLEEIEKLFVLPSGGDESLAIGGAIFFCYELGGKLPSPLKQIYFGPEYTEEECLQEVKKFGFKVKKIPEIEKFVAQLLKEGKILARFCGRMEFGKRALGNRSILANPSNPLVVKRINEAIKRRDFWMPFAPSILEERANDYLINPKSYYAPYMEMAFPTKVLAHEELIAALHPYDYTTRPQIVRKEWNPSYYKTLKEFEKLTKIGALLNTSFNLHGEPIVCSPYDALVTFSKADLDGLIMGNLFVSK